MARVIKQTDLPVLDSTRDGRDRVDLITEELFGLTSIKADKITYHPGDTAAAHYHRDAKHFFLVLDGSGVLHIDDASHDLGPGDVALVVEDEVHWFENPTDGTFTFIELWVPQPSETVWVKDDDV